MPGRHRRASARQPHGLPELPPGRRVHCHRHTSPTLTFHRPAGNAHGYCWSRAAAKAMPLRRPSPAFAAGDVADHRLSPAVTSPWEVAWRHWTRKILDDIPCRLTAHWAVGRQRHYPLPLCNPGRHADLVTTQSLTFPPLEKPCATQWPAGRRRRPVRRPPGPGLSPRLLPVVRRPADSLVVAGPAHRVFPDELHVSRSLANCCASNATR
jgi:hypothetical protein